MTLEVPFMFLESSVMLPDNIYSIGLTHDCKPDNLLLGLLNQGVHHERNKTFYLQQNNNSKIGRWSFKNRLNNILSLLGDKWLDQSQTGVKKMWKIFQQNVLKLP